MVVYAPTCVVDLLEMPAFHDGQCIHDSAFSLKVVRFAKAMVCLGVHFFFVQYLPVDILNSDWYYSLSLVRRCPSSLQPANAVNALAVSHPQTCTETTLQNPLSSVNTLKRELSQAGMCIFSGEGCLLEPHLQGQ